LLETHNHVESHKQTRPHTLKALGQVITLFPQLITWEGKCFGMGQGQTMTGYEYSFLNVHKDHNMGASLD